MTKQYTPQQRTAAFEAADRYFEQLEQGILTPPALRGIVRRRNPLFSIVYADGYLEGLKAQDANATPLIAWIREHHVPFKDSDVVDIDHGPIVEWTVCAWCSDHFEDDEADWPCMFIKALDGVPGAPETPIHHQRRDNWGRDIIRALTRKVKNLKVELARVSESKRWWHKSAMTYRAAAERLTHENRRLMQRLAELQREQKTERAPSDEVAALRAALLKYGGHLDINCYAGAFPGGYQCRCGLLDIVGPEGHAVMMADTRAAAAPPETT